MIVWRLTGAEVDYFACGAYHFATKKEAVESARKNGFKLSECEFDRIRVTNRCDLAAELNDAMGYGGS